jgi:thioredoxin 1
MIVFYGKGIKRLEGGKKNKRERSRKERMPVLSSLHPNDLLSVLKNNVNIVILRFTAVWCGPCKRIEPVIQAWLDKMPADVMFYSLDIDENVEIYSYFKSKRRVNGVPAIMCFSRGNLTYIADEFVSSSVLEDISRFFEKSAVLWQRNQDLNAVVQGNI